MDFKTEGRCKQPLAPVYKQPIKFLHDIVFVRTHLCIITSTKDQSREVDTCEKWAKELQNFRASPPAITVHRFRMASPQPAKTKDEQLARVRRNQQRCRDRKRAHVASLETQVETLRTRLQSCQPCDVQSPIPESEIETLRRQNAARKDLLAALGFDEDSQKKFIDHEVYRQAVRSVFQGQVVGNDILAPTEQYDLADFGLDDAWLPTSVDDPISGLDDLDLALAGQTKKSDVEQCFLDTAISIQPMETSTPCSMALSWILQNNVKGYTLAAIQDRLRDGVICAAGPGQECRVKNNVLFQVLAEVSSGG